METPDPLKALKSRSIHDRAAAARDLSRFGTLEHIPLLIDKAQTDKSPAVRLGTAGAAADILSRHRIGARAASLDAQQRRTLLDLFRGVDPGVNAGLFSMLACIGLPEGAQRIVTGLRDPRGGVRVGAGVGLMRLCQSIAAYGDEGLETMVVTLLRDRRLKPDALAEVARVCAAVGYHSARPHMAALQLSGSHGEVVAQSIATLDALYDQDAAPCMGAWCSDGRDIGEVNPQPDLPPAIMVVGDHGALIREGQGDWVIEEHFPHEPVRRMHVRRVGQHSYGPALQVYGRSWYRAADDDLLAAVDAVVQPQTIDWGRGLPAHGLAERVVELLAPLLPQTAAGLRTRALVLGDAGLCEAAFQTLEAAVAAKKTPVDTWLFLGDCLAAQGRQEEARQAWETAVKKARRKRVWFVVQARARLAD